MTELLVLESVSVRRGTKLVLDNHDFSLNSNEIVLMVGRNGSGKSTMIEAACGLVKIGIWERYGIWTINQRFRG